MQNNDALILNLMQHKIQRKIGENKNNRKRRINLVFNTKQDNLGISTQPGINTIKPPAIPPQSKPNPGSRQLVKMKREEGWVVNPQSELVLSQMF